MHYANGSVYKGEFYMGEKNGKGSYVGVNKYEGEWNMNMKEGI